MSHWMNCSTLFIIVAVVVMTAAHVVTPFQQKQPLLSIVPRTTYHLHIISSSSSISTISSSLSSSTSSSQSPSFEGGFDVHQMDALEQRGKLEASFMEDLMMGVLGEEKNDANNNKNIQKNTGKKKKKNKKKNKSPSAAIVARTLKQEGVVRLHKILSTETATALRQDILDRRDAAYASLSDMENNENNNDEEWRKYFADVLLKGNKGQRCDLLLPLAQNPILQQALKEILISSTLLSSTLNIAQGGDDSTLYEMAALISEPGSSRQPIHPDNPFQDIVPLHTVFIALQDITTSMGPTYFIPRSHNNAKIHAAYNDVTPPNSSSSNSGNDRSGSGRDELLRNSSSRVALLPTGDAALFDSRILHCGGENKDSKEGGQTRVLLYLSFQNPRAKEPIGNVGSLLPAIKPTTIRELRTRLGPLISTTTTNMNMNGSNNKIGYSVDPFINDNKDIDNAENLTTIKNNKLYLSATQDNRALSQLELGISYYVGDGSNGIHTIDLLEAMKWFTLASNQGLAQAQYNLGCCYSDCVGVEFENGIDVNLNHSLELFELAAAQNYPGAKEARDELLTTL
mmetsp:Transcript_33898/g.38622  ORF Transcript_33898/g.38622 Transcript_33898/m.38622 type:complete len:570 (+) Transcript_33898:80-1789(+)